MTARRLITLLGAALALLLSSLACCFGAPEAVRKGIQMEWPWTVVRGSGETAIEQRSESGFDAVALRGIGTLYIEQGDEESVEIEAEDNLIEYLETQVQDGILRIKHRNRVNLRPREPVNFYLTAKALDTIMISGSGDVEASDLSASRFSVTISGSGDVEVGSLGADVLEVEISGSGKVGVAGGEVAEQEVTISGSGKYAARDMESARAAVRITGSGDATIRVRDDLHVNIKGSGDVRYAGSPRVDTTTLGLGAIDKIGD